MHTTTNGHPSFGRRWTFQSAFRAIAKVLHEARRTRPVSRYHSQIIFPMMVGFVLCVPGGIAQTTVAIPGLFNTGVDNSNALLSGGATDPHYHLITSADPSFPGPDAMVVYTSGYPFPFWLSDGPKSEWIAPSANEDLVITPGLYVYRTTFNLTGLDPSTAVIKGQWSTDNQGVNILINGMSTGITNSNQFSSFTPFTISSGFVSGLNTLAFEVNNGPTSGTANPTGLRVELSGTAKPLPPCALTDTATYSATTSTLTMKFTVGNNLGGPAIWNAWLTYADPQGTDPDTMQLLFSVSQPITNPPKAITKTFGLPKEGMVGILSTLSTTKNGIACSSWVKVNTGTDPLSP